jgi:tetratricopeptide (TPR) repeat protein
LEAQLRVLLQEMSQAEMDRAINFRPDMSSAAQSQAATQYHLARLFYERHESEKARKTLEASLSRFPDHAPSHLLAGQLALQDKDYKQALPHFEQALKLDPNLAEAQKCLRTSQENL